MLDLMEPIWASLDDMLAYYVSVELIEAYSLRLPVLVQVFKCFPCASELRCLSSAYQILLEQDDYFGSDATNSSGTIRHGMKTYSTLCSEMGEVLSTAILLTSGQSVYRDNQHMLVKVDDFYGMG